jgi:hypothetical protein
MIVLGFEVPHELELAAAEWMHAGAFTQNSLTAFLARELPSPLGVAAERRDVANRIADKLIQRHRQRGDIAIRDRLRTPVWAWVSDE